MTRTAAKKLTDCPSNLKEAIDWILRVTGKDGVYKTAENTNIEALAREVRVLLVSVKVVSLPYIGGIMKEIEEYAGSGHDPISKLAEALRVFTGYDKGARGTIEETGIAMRPKRNSHKPYNSVEEWRYNNDGYFFSYPSNATWRQDVQHAQDVGTKAGGDGSLSKFMQPMGYQWKSLSKNKCGNVMKKVANSLQDLNVSTNGGYSTYIGQIEKNARSNLSTHAYNYPLYGLYYAACEYFKFQYQSNSNIVYINNMKSTLNNLSRSSGSYGDFKEHIQAFLSQVENTVDSGSSGHLPGSSDQENVSVSGAAAYTISCSVGYAAGGIVGTAAVGTGVALATNVGGVTTLIKGAIGMV
ncbi:variant erythrocyte surface antigen-1, alpha subunit [Babesia caballi]|uniref:Variant erythrocyte surface antigen-1, alpha subunit n=1 Tax=Babesia caballi TaxID=5871 RepID=A0AAV4LPR5_BABCB|nr:variant erythrocyte surface antigen-1, alpha subunit [Babesia caballi]